MAEKKFKIKGMKKLMENLNNEIQAIEGRSMKGLIEGVRIIRYDMGKTPPLVPVDTRNLDSSFFTSPIRKGKNPVLQFGFSANYAAFVHEMSGRKFQRPGAGPRFLYAAIERNKDNVLEAIRKNAEIK